MPDTEAKDLVLPLSITSPQDVTKLIREIGLIDEHLSQQAIIHPDKKLATKVSTKLDDLLSTNGLDISKKTEREALIGSLADLSKTAPVVHISFGAEADDDFIGKIAEWFRREVNPRCLLIVGLDSSIGVGSIVRTTNQVIDLSLRSRLKTTQALLLSEIERLSPEVIR